MEGIDLGGFTVSCIMTEMIKQRCFVLNVFTLAFHPKMFTIWYEIIWQRVILSNYDDNHIVAILYGS